MTSDSIKTLGELIVDSKCRKGTADGTNKRGAYWLAAEPIVIRRYGGDGIGNGGADCTNYLELRHYRTGDVSAVLHGHWWHQNGSRPDVYERFDELLACKTVEDMIVALKGVKVDEDTTAAYSDMKKDVLTDALTKLGMPLAAPSPDEV